MKPSKEKVYIYGKHALMEALVSTPHIIKKVFLSNEAADKDLKALLADNSIPTVPLATNKGKEMVGRDATHQGVIAIMDPSALLTSFEDFIEKLDTSKNPSIAILGEIHDPHNVGAIIRSAAAFGLSAVLIPERHQAGVTGVVVKSSAGMAFRIPLVSIGNVNNTIKILKEKGFWTYGLAMGGKRILGIEKFDTPTAFVIGNEGAGIREKTLEACDVSISIPMHPRTESLNAAVSAAVVFYEWSKKHPEAL
jgi:23S rRNA (guanosine2251-2'-O)-methyltransferase